MSALTPAAAATPYDPQKGPDGEILESEFRFQNPDGSWMMKWEVAKLRQMERASHGDLDALKQIEERELGKPAQQVNTLAITTTLESLLELVEKNEQSYHPPSLPSYVIVDETIIHGEAISDDDDEDGFIV